MLSPDMPEEGKERLMSCQRREGLGHTYRPSVATSRGQHSKERHDSENTGKETRENGRQDEMARQRRARQGPQVGQGWGSCATRAGHLCEGPVLGNAHKGQALLEAQGPLGPLHNVHKVDVAIPNLLHLQHQGWANNKTSK